MKLDLVPESLLDRTLLAAGAIPRPLAHTMLAILMSRTILAAVKMGVFEGLSGGPKSASALADGCGLDARACDKLLQALTGLGYVRFRADKYSLTPMSRKWLGVDRGPNMTRALLHRYLDLELLEHTEEYLRSGSAVDFHRRLSAEQWSTYMNGQRGQAALILPELVRRTPVPRGASEMMDLGGGHGLFADAMCRRHPALNATVLDLPEAIGAVDRSNLSDRVRFVEGDVFHVNLDQGKYDLVFAGNLLHHFTDAQNRDLIGRASRCLKPSGVFVVADFVRVESFGRPRQIPALLDFYFAVTSGGGTLSSKLVRAWMMEAGLDRIRASKMVGAPGMVLLSGYRTV